MRVFHLLANDSFDAMYADVGRPSIAPEKLLRSPHEHPLEIANDTVSYH
jgi:hypothetical protein